MRAVFGLARATWRGVELVSVRIQGGGDLGGDLP